MNDPKEPFAGVHGTRAFGTWDSSDSDWENRNSKCTRSDSKALQDREMSRIYVERTSNDKAQSFTNSPSQNRKNFKNGENGGRKMDRSPRQPTDSDDEGWITA